MENVSKESRIDLIEGTILRKKENVLGALEIGP